MYSILLIWNTTWTTQTDSDEPTTSKSTRDETQTTLLGSPLFRLIEIPSMTWQFKTCGEANKTSTKKNHEESTQNSISQVYSTEKASWSPQALAHNQE